MPPGGSLPGGRFSSASGGAQKNTPELPPLERCRHSSESSRFVTGCFVRITPIGFPVHFTALPCHVHVSGSPLTFWKSSPVRSRQPRSRESTTIVNGPTASSALPGIAAPNRATTSQQQGSDENRWMYRLMLVSWEERWRSRDGSRWVSSCPGREKVSHEIWAACQSGYFCWPAPFSGVTDQRRSWQCNWATRPM